VLVGSFTGLIGLSLFYRRNKQVSFSEARLLLNFLLLDKKLDFAKKIKDRDFCPTFLELSSSLGNGIKLPSPQKKKRFPAHRRFEMLIIGSS